jgi:hypothetical protein
VRALTAAAVGLAVALVLVFAITGLASCASPGETSPKPLLTTVPGPKT